MYANDAFFNDFKETYRCGVVGVVVLPDMITSTIIFYGAWVVRLYGMIIRLIIAITMEAQACRVGLLLFAVQ